MAKKRTQIPEPIREALIDRVEEATASGVLILDADRMAVLLFVLFPEDFRPPPPPETRATTPPSSAARVTEYAARVAAGESIFRADDAKGDQGRGMRTRWSQTCFPKVLGWEDGQGDPADE